MVTDWIGKQILLIFMNHNTYIWINRNRVTFEVKVKALMILFLVTTADLKRIRKKSEIFYIYIYETSDSRNAPKLITKRNAMGTLWNDFTSHHFNCSPSTCIRSVVVFCSYVNIVGFIVIVWYFHLNIEWKKPNRSSNNVDDINSTLTQIR